MEKLRAYLNSLSVSEQDAFAVRCGTTLGYLRKALSKGQQFSESLCLNIERESNYEVKLSDLHGDFFETLKSAGYGRPEKKTQRKEQAA